MASGFINVDLDLDSDSPLDEFCKAFEALNEEVTCLVESEGDNGRYFARFECFDGGVELEPEDVINRFCDFIDKLDAEQRLIFDMANSRVFDIGYEVYITDHYSRQIISSKTIERIHGYKASVAMTCYRRNEYNTENKSE